MIVSTLEVEALVWLMGKLLELFCLVLEYKITGLILQMVLTWQHVQLGIWLSVELN